MKEIKGNIFSPDLLDNANAICFTSNGVVKSNGRLTMGAGIALTFRELFKDIDLLAGHAVKANGNICQVVYDWRNLKDQNRIIKIVAFPTKNHWRSNSDLSLIVSSTKQLIELINFNCWSKVLITRMGTGNGGLNWEKQVKPAVENILDDRVCVVSL